MPTKAGRYEIREELGRGAMGIVYKGFDPMIRRVVAIKTLRLTEEGTGMAKPELISRFQTEARAAGVLTHPNIVTVYDAGEDEGLFYITMEFVEGRSLQSVMDQRQVFPLARVLRIMEQACGALSFAHRHGIVHRDIKPANLMLAEEDLVKVTDFGTAKILQISTTQTGNIIGTPSYMSPEQVKGKLVDGRSDIFSLGVVLYELVTGEKPFPGQNVTTVIYKIVNEEPVPPRQLDSSIHPGLSFVISKSLAKEPDRRYQTCQEFLEDLKSHRALGTESDPYGQTVVMFTRPRLPDAAEASPAPSTGVSATPQRETSGTLYATGPVVPPPVPPQATPPPPRPQPARPPLRYAEEQEEIAPKKRSSLGLVLLLLVLLAVSGYLLWPSVQEVLDRRHDIAVSPVATPAQGPPTGEAAQVGATGVSQPPAATEKADTPEPPPSQPETKAETEPVAPAPATKAPSAKASEISAPTARELENLKSRIEQRISQAQLTDKVRVEIRDGDIRLTGTLTPQENRRLRERMRGVSGARLRNLIREERGAPTETEPAPPGDRPRTAQGMGEVEVLTDVSGAQAMLTAPDGARLDCRTPCRFEELLPGRYTLDVTRAGYRTERRIINVRAGVIDSKDIRLQPLAGGIAIVSRPSGAEVFVNGQRQPELTPTTIRLAPGSYEIGVRKAGHTPFVRTVQLSGDDLQQLQVELPQLPQTRALGWVEVRTIPPGADIIVNGTNTGYKSPQRLELPAGTYTLALLLRGYLPKRVTIEVREGQTIQVHEELPRP